MDLKHILIFPAGSASGLEIYQAIKDNIHFEAYGASSKTDHAEYVYPVKRLFISDRLYIGHKLFLQTFVSLLERWSIDYIIPTHDSVARVLMEIQPVIRATVVCSPLKTSIIAEDKHLIYQNLKGCPYCPKVYENLEEIKYPAFLKPRVSVGGKGTAVVKNAVEYIQAERDVPGRLVCEYLPGKEYTVDCFTDKTGRLLFIGPRTRKRITWGVAFSSEPVDLTPEIEKIATDINKRFCFRGAWFFQLKEDKRCTLKLLEFSVRQSSTIALYRHLGVNFAVLSLFDFMGFPVQILYNNFPLRLDRGMETLYHAEIVYDTIYLDYDDTLIINKKVNLEVIQLIYQAVSKNISVILLSKHEGDIYQSLMDYKISEMLFSEIIVIPPNKKKADYIAKRQAIYIDNHFPERQQVYMQHQIPVFDVDAVDCLIDRRES